MLEIRHEGHNDQNQPDDSQPNHAVGEVRIDAEQHTGDHRREFGLPFAINEVAHSDCAGDDADEKAIHDRSCRDELFTPQQEFTAASRAS